MSRRPERAKAAHGRAPHELRDLVHRLEIAVGGDREARLDHVDAHFLERFGDRDLLLDVHRRARRLLPVAQRGIEDVDHIRTGFGTHRPTPSRPRSGHPTPEPCTDPGHRHRGNAPADAGSAPEPGVPPPLLPLAARQDKLRSNTLFSKPAQSLFSIPPRFPAADTNEKPACRTASLRLGPQDARDNPGRAAPRQPFAAAARFALPGGECRRCRSPHPPGRPNASAAGPGGCAIVAPISASA